MCRHNFVNLIYMSDISVLFFIEQSTRGTSNAVQETPRFNNRGEIESLHTMGKFRDDIFLIFPRK